MFSRPLKLNTAQVRIKLISSDAALAERLGAELAADPHYHLEVVKRNAVEAEALTKLGANCSVLVIDVDPRDARETAALETIIAAAGGEVPIIVASEDLGTASARRLLHLGVADWLPRQSNAAELRQACERAITAKESNGRTQTARCIAFYPAMGGVGTTTLAVAAAFHLAGGKKQPHSACLVDLDLQSGAMADHLDLPANLQLEAIIATPERLDSHLLEVMLSRHASGVALLAAPNSLIGFEGVEPDLIARLLDHAAAKFDNLIVDLPRLWQPWSENVLTGADRFFVVTELSVPGLRQARRVADELHRRFDMPLKGRVIVNKAHWLGSHGVKKRDAYEALGERLAGFVADLGSVVAQAQNRGVPLSEVRRANRLEKDLAAILKAS